MKKNIVLGVLFILPIVAYLFFASGVHGFANLPTITKSINDVDVFKTIAGEFVTLNNKITVLGFPGIEVLKNKGNAFNLSQKIYDKNREFKDFQLVMIMPNGTQKDTEQLKYELGRISNLERWTYVFGSPEQIKAFYKSLNLIGGLDANYATSNVYIIDKNKNLRGRKGKDKKGNSEYKEGYNTISAADLHNDMADDVKIILAEYRLALKKNNANRIK